MAYNPLNLGSDSTSKESLDTSLRKINDMLGELYTLPFDLGDGDIVFGNGFTGSQGIPGTQGIQGFTGSQGATGFTGSRGFVGSAGAGFTGSQGIPGFTGSVGFSGSQGDSGLPGTTGFTGSQGVIGFTGSKGDSVSFQRTFLSGTTGTLASGASENLNITGFSGYVLFKIQTSDAAWVRVYTDAVSRTNDQSRPESEDPLPGSGVIAEVITNSAETILISPGTIGFNNENPVTDIVPIRVTNNSGSAAAITVTLTALPIESQ